MNIIKVNYNNAYIKIPKKISPFLRFYVGRKNGEKYLFLSFVDNLTNEPIYDKYQFDIYVNDIFVAYVNETSEKLHEVTSEVIGEDKKIRVDVKGYYYNDAGMRQDIDSLYFLVSTMPICSRSLLCSKNICVETDLVNV